MTAQVIDQTAIKALNMSAYDIGFTYGSATTAIIDLLRRNRKLNKKQIAAIGMEFKLGFVVGRLDGVDPYEEGYTRAMAVSSATKGRFVSDSQDNDKKRTKPEQDAWYIANSKWSYACGEAGLASQRNGAKRKAKKRQTKVSTANESPKETKPAANPLASPQEAVFAIGGVDSVAELHALHNNIAALISACMARFAKAYTAEYRNLDMDYVSKIKALANGVTGEAVKPKSRGK